MLALTRHLATLVLLACVAAPKRHQRACLSVVVTGGRGISGRYEQLAVKFNAKSVYQGPKKSFLFFAASPRFVGWAIAHNKPSNLPPFLASAPGFTGAPQLARAWHGGRAIRVVCAKPRVHKWNVKPAGYWENLLVNTECNGLASYFVSTQRPQNCSVRLHDDTSACQRTARGFACDHTTLLEDCFECARAFGWPFLRHAPRAAQPDARCSYMNECGVPYAQRHLVNVYELKSHIPTPMPTSPPTPQPSPTPSPTPKPGACIVSEWKPETTCTRSCGGGEKRYSRRILRKPAKGHAPCPKLFRNSRCNIGACPVRRITLSPSPAPSPAPTPRPTAAPTQLRTVAPTPPACHDSTSVQLHGHLSSKRGDLFGEFVQQKLIVSGRHVYKRKHKDWDSTFDDSGEVYLFYMSDDNVKGWVVARGMSRLDKIQIATASVAMRPEQTSRTWFAPPGPWGASKRRRARPDVTISCVRRVPTTTPPSLPGWAALQQAQLALQRKHPLRVRLDAGHGDDEAANAAKDHGNSLAEQAPLHVYFTLQLMGLSGAEILRGQNHILTALADSIGVPEQYVTLDGPYELRDANSTAQGGLLNVALGANGKRLCDQVGSRFCTAKSMIKNMADAAFLDFLVNAIERRGIAVHPLPAGLRLSQPVVRPAALRLPQHNALGAWDIGIKQKANLWMKDELGQGWKGSKLKAIVRGFITTTTHNARKAPRLSAPMQLNRGMTDDDATDDHSNSREQNIVILATCGVLLVVAIAVALGRTTLRYSRINADYSDEDGDDANEYDSDDALDEYEDDDNDLHSEGIPLAKQQPKRRYTTSAGDVSTTHRHPNQEPSPSDQGIDSQDRISQPGRRLSRRRGRGASTPPPSHGRIEAL